MNLIFLLFCAHNHLLFAFEKEMATQLKLPWELRKLDALLYEFLLSPDREGFAKTHQIFFQKGRVRVNIVMIPNISQGEKDCLGKTYRIEIEKESQDLLRALVPVEELTSLAKEELIWSIRLPDRPMIQ